MNIEELRPYCLSLPDTTEKIPFEAFSYNHESLLAFYARKHIFCMVDIDANDECTVKYTAQGATGKCKTFYPFVAAVFFALTI